MFSICIPTYNCSDTIKKTIYDVLEQTYQDFEIIISDDNSTDDIEQEVKIFGDKRIRFYKNGGKQLGCGGNEEKCRKLAKGEFIIMLPGKARVSKHMLERYHYLFTRYPQAGAITRPYFWFGRRLHHVVRKKDTHYPIDMLVDINKFDFDIDLVIAVFETVDNSGGIAYRKEWITEPFNNAPFVEFTYPFAQILKDHPVVLVSDYMMACPAFKHSHSQDKEVYKTSPMKNWIDMFNYIYCEDRYSILRKKLISQFVAVNYIGLVQVRNYGTYLQYLREVWYLIWYRSKNLLSPMFWFFFLGIALMPRRILKKLVKWHKERRNLDVRLF